MKRFWKEARTEAGGGGYLVTLDGRAVKTQGGQALILPNQPLAEALAAEWQAQAEVVDPASFMLRDLADFAIDSVAENRAATIEQLLRFADTDTLCYRAEPEEPLRARQEEVWEPLVAAAEARWDVRFNRIAGVIHQPLPAQTLARLVKPLDAQDDFTLSALNTMASLAASLIVAMATLDEGADGEALWAAASLEEDWQAELWGKDWEAEERRARRQSAFLAAMRFAQLVRG